MIVKKVDFSIPKMIEMGIPPYHPSREWPWLSIETTWNGDPRFQENPHVTTYNQQICGLNNLKLGYVKKMCVCNMINESLWWFFSGSIATGSLLQFANWKITMKIVGTVNHRTNVFSMLCEIIAGCMNVSNKCGFQSIQHRYLWFSRKRTCGLENRYILTWLVGGFNPEECARHWRSSSSSLSLSSLSSPSSSSSSNIKNGRWGTYETNTKFLLD